MSSQDSFGRYLVKQASLEALGRAGSAGGGTMKVDRATVEKAVSASKEGKASKSQQALLVALGIGVGAGGVLLYQQHKRAKQQRS
jgi:uncharacterized protein HemX